MLSTTKRTLFVYILFYHPAEVQTTHSLSKLSASTSVTLVGLALISIEMRVSARTLAHKTHALHSHIPCYRQPSHIQPSINQIGTTLRRTNADCPSECLVAWLAHGCLMAIVSRAFNVGKCVYVVMSRHTIARTSVASKMYVLYMWFLLL